MAKLQENLEDHDLKDKGLNPENRPFTGNY